MEKKRMNNIELKAVRTLLGFSTDEAAKHIGGVSPRSWQFWEKGERKIPQDVIDKLNFLLSRRREIISTFQEKMEGADKIAVVYYETPEHCSSVIEWRFSQSLATTLAFDFGAVLVPFDFQSYSEFLQGFKLEDTPASRSEWATLQASVK